VQAPPGRGDVPRAGAERRRGHAVRRGAGDRLRARKPHCGQSRRRACGARNAPFLHHQRPGEPRPNNPVAAALPVRNRASHKPGRGGPEPLLDGGVARCGGLSPARGAGAAGARPGIRISGDAPRERARVRVSARARAVCATREPSRHVGGRGGNASHQPSLDVSHAVPPRRLRGSGRGPRASDARPQPEGGEGILLDRAGLSDDPAGRCDADLLPRPGRRRNGPSLSRQLDGVCGVAGGRSPLARDGDPALSNSGRKHNTSSPGPVSCTA